MKVLLILVVAVVAASCSKTVLPSVTAIASADNGPSLQVTDMDGGSVVTDLGYKIRVNDGSSLHRHWYILNDQGAPVSLSSVGVKTSYRSESYGGEYRFLPVGMATPTMPIQAVETRMMIFDIWGNHMKTLTGTQVRDFAAGAPIDLSKSGSWRTSENEVSEVLTVVSFVANVRKLDGTIWTCDVKKVFGEVQRIKVKLSESDLTPEREKGAK